jgi:integrase
MSSTATADSLPPAALQERRESKLIGLRAVQALEPNSEIFDGGRGAVGGFGARRRSGPGVAYFVFYRVNGKQRRHTIGTHGSPWTPDTARAEARRILGAVSGGADPAAIKHAKRHAPTVKDLCDRYWAACRAGEILVRGGRPKTAGTLVGDHGRIFIHIVPTLGNERLADVRRKDIADLLHAVAQGRTATAPTPTKARGRSAPKGGQTAANRTVGLFGAMLRWAVEQGLLDANPAQGIRTFRDNTRERRLTPAEYGKLRDGLAAAVAAGMWPAAVGCAAFLAVSGWRRGEAIGLRREYLDLDRRIADLPATKTGRSIRPLSRADVAILRAQPVIGDGALVFPPARGGSGATMSGFPKYWRQIAELGGLPADVLPHALRHSFASTASELGHNESTIGALIGHKVRGTTARYIHGAADALLAAADATADTIVGLMAADNPPQT